MLRTRFLVLLMVPLLSGCAESIRDTYNNVTVATGCHLLRDAETRECQRLTWEQTHGAAQAQPAADSTPKP